MRGRSGIEGKFFLDGSLVYRLTVSYKLSNSRAWSLHWRCFVMTSVD